MSVSKPHISPEVLEWARREAGSHHSRCATGHDKGCDCYNSNPQRGHYVFAHAVVNLAKQLVELRRIEDAAAAFLTACDEEGCSDAPLAEFCGLVEAVSRLPEVPA